MQGLRREPAEHQGRRFHAPPAISLPQVIVLSADPGERLGRVALVSTVLATLRVGRAGTGRTCRCGEHDRTTSAAAGRMNEWRVRSMSSDLPSSAGGVQLLEDTRFAAGKAVATRLCQHPQSL
jgi:hypothetical protein